VKVPFLDRFAPHVLAGALCIGLAGSLAVRAAGTWTLAGALTAVIASVAVDDQRRRLVALGLALTAAGLWWRSIRLDALDRSVLAPRVGEVGPAHDPRQRHRQKKRTALR
jgi:hypothetical protein